MAMLQRRTMYALEALAYMARGHGGFVTVAEMARELKLPKPFLRSTFQVLARYGLVESRKGPTGGFRFVDPPKKMTLHGIVLGIQGRLVIAPSIGKGRDRDCLVQLQKNVEKLLKEITLDDLVKES